MKKITINLSIIFGSLLLLGCSNASDEGYVIEGEFFVPNRTIHLCNNNDTLATSQMIDGKFQFEGDSEIIQTAYIYYGEKEGIPIILENEELNIAINSLNINDIDYSSNSQEQLLFSEYLKLNKVNEDIEKISSLKFREMSRSSDRKISEIAYDTYSKVLSKRRKSEDVILKNHPDSYTSLFIANKWKSNISDDDFIKRFESLGKTYSSRPEYKDLESKYNSFKNIVVGKKAPDFTMFDTLGKKVSLYDIKGKIKIIDFWASWCGPCRALNPELIAIYEQYKDKGLTILSVSMDDNKGRWLKAVKEDKLPWQQISDLEAWDGQVSKDYNIEAIPYLVVLNENNEILGVKLYKEELKKLLAKEFN